MDRTISKWIGYLAIALVVAYLYVHLDSIAGGVRGFVNNWWR